MLLEPDTSRLGEPIRSDGIARQRPNEVVLRSQPVVDGAVVDADICNTMSDRDVKADQCSTYV